MASLPDSTSSTSVEDRIDLIWLIDHTSRVAPATVVEAVDHQLRQESLSEIAVCDGDTLVGVCTRAEIGALLGSRFGYSVCAQKPISRYMSREYLALRRGTPIDEVLERALSRNGEAFHNALAVIDGQGAFLGFIGVPTLYRLQAELLRQNARLLEQARDEALRAAELKSRFLANMSHEIRTPMNGVLGFLDLLGQTRLDDDQRECVETAQHSARTLLRLLDDILDLARVEAGRLPLVHQPFDLKETVQEVCALLSVQAGAKGLALHLDFAPETPPYVVADRLRVTQVLINLGGNAVKFTQSGWVRIAVRPSSAPGEAGLVEFIIEDTGIGLPSDGVDRLFDAFQQADSSTTRRFGGSGLGLAIVRQLVGLMGGTLSAANRSDGGSIFRATLRLEPAPAQAVEPRRAGLPENDVRLSGLRVLVAEDNPVNLKLATRMLERLGCDVDTASNGLEAVAKVAHSSFDLVLMDCQMPAMDGYAATRAIRGIEAEHPGRRALPIVGLTAHAMPGDRERCLEAGMSEYLSKPIDVERLRSTLVATLDVSLSIPCPS